MGPDGKVPVGIANEVGMIVGDLAVVYGLLFASGEDFFDGDETAVVAAELVAGLELFAVDPAFVQDEEGVIVGIKSYVTDGSSENL